MPDVSNRLYAHASYYHPSDKNKATITHLEIGREKRNVRAKLLEFDLSLGGRPLLLAEKSMSASGYLQRRREGYREGEVSYEHRFAQSGHMMVFFPSGNRLEKNDAFLILMDRNQELVLSDITQLVARVESLPNTETVTKSIAFDGSSKTFAVVNHDKVEVFGPKLRR